MTAKAEREFNQGIRAFNRQEDAPTDKRSALYAGWMAGKKMAALRKKELQKMRARVMREAARKVEDAITFINRECPEKLEEFKTEIASQFAAPETTPADEPLTTESVETEPTEDRRELVKAVKDRFRRQFGFTAMALQEVNAKFVRRTLSAHLKELPTELQRTDEAFWIAADKLMESLVLAPT